MSTPANRVSGAWRRRNWSMHITPISSIRLSSSKSIGKIDTSAANKGTNNIETPVPVGGTSEKTQTTNRPSVPQGRGIRPSLIHEILSQENQSRQIPEKLINAQTGNLSVNARFAVSSYTENSKLDKQLLLTDILGFDAYA